MNQILDDNVAAISSETYLMTHTTITLLSSDTIRRALGTYQIGLKSQEKDSLFTVNKYQTRFYRVDGSAVNHDPDNLIRTQDLEPWYEENSNLYLFNRASFAQTGARIGKAPILFTTPTLEAADIDDATGWRLAEIIALAEMLVESTNIQK